MTKQEMLDQIENLKAQVEAMPDDEPETCPRYGILYYFVGDCGTVFSDIWRGCKADQYRLEHGNAYSGIDEAIDQAVDFVQKVWQKALENHK